MRNYKIEYCDYTPYEPYYLITTCNSGLAAALGSIGYTVLVDRAKNEHFPVFNIVSRVFPDLDIEVTERNINKYYQGYFMVDANLFASNIEILSNVICSQLRHTYNNEMPLKKSEVLVNRQYIKEVKKWRKLLGKQNSDSDDNQKQNSDYYDYDIPF